MNYHIVFAIISSVIGIICFLPYIRDIFRKTTKPHIYTWLIWTTLQTIGVAGMIRGGAGIGALSLTIGAGFCLFIFLLSFKYGTKNITLFDTLCLVGAFVAIVLYLTMENPLWSVIVVAFIDLVGFLPTIRKAYEDPSTETASTYMLSATSSTFALGALSIFSVVTTLYLISLIITNSICAAVILLRRKALQSKIKPI